jgi:hypothetical protein
VPGIEGADEVYLRNRNGSSARVPGSGGLLKIITRVGVHISACEYNKIKQVWQIIPEM